MEGHVCAESRGAAGSRAVRPADRRRRGHTTSPHMGGISMAEAREPAAGGAAGAGLPVQTKVMFIYHKKTRDTALRARLPHASLITSRRESSERRAHTRRHTTHIPQPTGGR